MNINLLPWREALAKKRVKYWFLSSVIGLGILLISCIVWQIKNQHALLEKEKMQQALEQKLADMTEKYVSALNKQDELDEEAFLPIQEISIQPVQKTFEEKLQVELIPLHYAKATELSALLQAKDNGLLSDRGSVIADPRTNQLWIKDTSEVLEEAGIFLQAIDIPAKQVQIAARIVNVDESSVEELGLKFGTTSSIDSSSAGELHMDMPLNINTGHFTVAIAKLGEGTLLDMELSALEREGHAHTVSHPQLMTTNRQPAVIESGQEIPYQEKTDSGATNVAFKKAVLSLKVTPEITPDNKILLSLTVNKDKVDALMVNGVPAISTQQVQSQILLNNGETIVLGGIYEQTNKDQAARIPFLSDIPVLGKLFVYQETRADRRELLIFITPQLLE